MPPFDGDSSKVYRWVQDLQEAVLRHRLIIDASLPTKAILDAIRSNLLLNAVFWWDACSARYGDDLEAMLHSFMEIIISQRSFDSFRNASPHTIITQADALHERGNHRDMTLIMLTLQELDCPHLQHRLKHLILFEKPKICWSLYKKCVKILYLYEAQRQKDICRPIRVVHDGLEKVWFRNHTEYQSRITMPRRGGAFCILCDSERHHTDRCHLMDEIQLLE